MILEALAPLLRAPAGDGSLQTLGVLGPVKSRLGGLRSIDDQQQLLTQWQELFRTGYLSWGSDLANPNPPFFHFTARGRRAISALSRDPGNPAGYLRAFDGDAALNAVSMAYLVEALECYRNGLSKAAAVMLGCSAESLALELRDAILAALQQGGAAVPKGLRDWQAKRVLDALREVIDGRSSTLDKATRESYEAHFASIAHHIRSARNDAGHPSSIDPVTEETVHASFLLFPVLARLMQQLRVWAATGFAPA